MKLLFKKILKITLIFSLFLTSNACKENVAEWNVNPNFPGATTPNNRLAAILAYSGEGHCWAGIRGATGPTFFTRQLALRTVGSNIDRFFGMGNGQGVVWQRFYFFSGGNIAEMIKEGQKEGSPYYVGIGKIMFAFNFGHLTDMFGEIPVSESYVGLDNLAPKYDTQEDIYKQIITWLDEGIADLSKPANQNLRAPRTDDLFYNGDIARWLKLAHGLKARYLNHLSNKSNYNPDAVLEATSRALSSNTDDAQITYTNTNTDNGMPVHRVRDNLLGLTVSQYFINYLDGTYTRDGLGATAIIDPRLPIMTWGTPNGTGGFAGRFLGISNGSNSAARPAATGFGDLYTSWYSINAWQMFTFPEVKFIEAEAAFRKGDRTRALNAYTEGIRAHMQKMRVPTADINTYLASAAVIKSTSALTLSHIMIQKHIALFMNCEDWVDVRRFNYSPDIYWGLVPPDDPNPDFKGEWPHRLFHDGTETLYNRARIESLGGFAVDYPTKKMWWAVP